MLDNIREMTFSVDSTGLNQILATQVGETYPEKSEIKEMFFFWYCTTLLKLKKSKFFSHIQYES